jgi:hypothetical protein
MIPIKSNWSGQADILGSFCFVLLFLFSFGTAHRSNPEYAGMLGLIAKTEKHTETTRTHSIHAGAQAELLHAQLLALHDTLMPMIDELMPLKQHINNKLIKMDQPPVTDVQDHLKQELQLISLAKEVAEAEESMISWMRQYKAPTDHLSPEARIIYLKAETKKLYQVRSAMFSCIAKARKIYKNNPANEIQ